MTHAVKMARRSPAARAERRLADRIVFESWPHDGRVTIRGAVLVPHARNKADDADGRRDLHVPRVRDVRARVAPAPGDVEHGSPARRSAASSRAVDATLR